MELSGGKILRRPAALADGLTDDHIRHAYLSGAWTRVAAGAYAGTISLARLESAERHRLLIDAVLARMADDAVVSHQSAAVLLGLPVWNVPLDRVHVTRDRRNGGRNRPLVHVHCAPVADAAVVDGRLVTTPARLVVDVARTVPFEQAVVIGDAAVRGFGVTAGDLADELHRAKRRNGWSKARAVVGFLDPHSESVGESRSRVLFRRAGGLVPRCQGNVYGADGTWHGRVDFFDDTGVVGEFDGQIKYGRLLRPGKPAGDAVFEEKCREDVIRDDLFQMVRWTWSELAGDGPVLSWRRAASRAVRRPPLGHIEQAVLPPARILDVRSL